MFKSIYWLVLFVFICLIAIVGYNAFTNSEVNNPSDNKSSEPTKKLVADILKASGVTKQIQQIPSLLKGSVEANAQQGMLLTKEQYESILQSIETNVLPYEMLEIISNSVRKAVNQKEAEVLWDWYQSPLAKKIAKAEESAQTDESYQQMVQQKKSLLSNVDKLKFAQKLDAVLNASKMTSKIHENVQFAVNESVLFGLVPNRPFQRSVIENELDSAGEQVNPALQQMVVTSFIYSYRDVSQNELKTYEHFLDELASKKFNRAVILGIHSGFENAILKWLKAVSVEMKKFKPAEFEDVV